MSHSWPIGCKQSYEPLLSSSIKAESQEQLLGRGLGRKALALPFLFRCLWKGDRGQAGGSWGSRLRRKKPCTGDGRATSWIIPELDYLSWVTHTDFYEREK